MEFGIHGHLTHLVKASVTSYFPPHQTKIRYLELSEQFSIDDAHGHKLLCTALLKRAMTDVERIWKLREEKAPLQQLVGKGAISHDVWEGLLAAEASMELEIQEVCLSL